MNFLWFGSHCPHLQLFLDALVLLGLSETVLLVAMVVDAFSLQVGAVRAGVLLAVAVVVQVVVHGGRWRWGGRCHHHVQLLLCLYQVVLGLPGLVRKEMDHLTGKAGQSALLCL